MGLLSCFENCIICLYLWFTLYLFKFACDFAYLCLFLFILIIPHLSSIAPQTMFFTPHRVSPLIATIQDITLTSIIHVWCLFSLINWLVWKHCVLPYRTRMHYYYSPLFWSPISFDDQKLSTCLNQVYALMFFSSFVTFIQEVVSQYLKQRNYPINVC